MLTEWKTGAARLSHITNTRMRKEQRTYLTYCVKAVGQQSDPREGLEARIPLHDSYTTNSFGRMIMLRTSLSFHSGQQ